MVVYVVQWSDTCVYMYYIFLASSSQPLGLMQFLESDETVSDDEIDRMHIRDNLKAVTVSCSLVNYLCIYTGNNNYSLCINSTAISC